MCKLRNFRRLVLPGSTLAVNVYDKAMMLVATVRVVSLSLDVVDFALGANVLCCMSTDRYFNVEINFHKMLQCIILYTML